MADYEDDASFEVVVPGEDKKIDTAKDVEDIVAQIIPGVTSLKLSGNSYGTEAAAAIGEALSHVASLKEALWSDMFVSRLKTEIPPALSSLGQGLITAGVHLVELDLSDNAFGPTGVEGVTTLLTSEVCYSLKILKFNNNGLGIGGGKILSQALLDCHSQAADNGYQFGLQVFESGRNRLENEGAFALSEVFETLSTLEEISLPQNGIYFEGITALATSMSKNPNLKVINLSDNTFGEEGSSAIANILPDLQKLQVINFGDCLVRSEGAIALATVLKDGHQLLEELNLSHGELDIEAGTAVVNAMSNKDQLRLLDLNGNMFGEDGIETIRELLEVKGRLDALGSLSDDEGVESDGAISEDDQDKSDIQVNEHEEITLDEWLTSPSEKGLLTLGEERLTLLQNYLTSTPSLDTLADIYIKVAIGYTIPFTNNELSLYQSVVHEFIDTCIQPICEDGHTTDFLNIILSLLGLIKHEDKSYKHVKPVDGPLLALTHYLARQSYFPEQCRDILIALITKPCSIDNFIELRHTLLYQLHN